MRSFNLLAVITVFSVMLLVFNFKTVVLGVMEAAGKLFITVMLAAARFLGSLFPSGSDLTDRLSEPADFGFFGGKTEVIHPFLNFLGNTARTFVLLYVLYKLIPLLIKQVFALILRLIAFLRRDSGQNILNRENSDYIDETESIRPVKERKQRQKIHRSLKSAEHELERTTDPIRRIRLIYGILLRKLEGAGVKRETCDTPAELYDKSKHINGLDIPLLSVTKQYEKVRYGGKAPDRGDLSRYEADYAETAHKLPAMPYKTIEKANG